MKTTTDYKFEVSITDQTFDHKPHKIKEIPYLRFTKKTVDVDDFLEYMLEGHGYTGVYSYDSFRMTQRNNKNYRYSYLVTIDVDHSSETMNEMIDKLEFKPTCAYTSFSDGKDGESRFRLVYCFDEIIEGKEEYCNYFYSVLAANGLELDDKVIDEKGREAIQYYNGNGSANFDFAVTDIIYSKKDFNIYYKDYYIIYNNINYKDNKSINENYINNYTPHNNIHLNDTFVNTEFASDYWNMRMEDILSKYIDIFPNMEHTPLEIPDDDTPYILYPDGYIEINRLCKVGKDKRYVRVKDCGTLKIKDGEGRRKTLFWNGIIRRLINPNITYDNLVYNLLYELCYYITNYNAENIIGKKEIAMIARDVMNKDMSNYERLRGSHKIFMVNPKFCIKYGLSKNEVKNMASKMIRYNKIGELYDCSQTDIKNLEIMKENGLKVSLSTLKRWRKENGITKYKI